MGVPAVGNAGGGIVCQRRVSARWAGMIGCVLSLIIGCAADAGWAQTIGDEAELERLRVKAEEAVGNDDPEGAAMAMGRAALMAKRLSQVHSNDVASARLYQGAEALFRSQEHGYRAMALFRRAGDQLPASSGVCGSLALAQASVQRALGDLGISEPPPDALRERVKHWRETADAWVTVVAAMITDYQCP